MQKPISRQTHAVLDYGYAALIAAAPELMGFKDEETATTMSRIVGGGVAAASLATRYELGAVPLISFRTHLTNDVVVGLLTMTAPWLLGFSGNARARNTFVGMGAFSVLAGLITEPEEMDEDR